MIEMNNFWLGYSAGLISTITAGVLTIGIWWCIVKGEVRK